MQLQQENYTEISNDNNVNISTFKISATPQAYKVLSDMLYSNKIPSIIRELCSNAHDSHICANNLDTAFEVKAPTNFNPYFKIRDYGTGLSEEDVLNLYSTYFDSTKNKSNDLIGGFGLGSKTPLLYGDSFIVKSYFNNTVTSYLVFFNNGIPNITKTKSEDTDEHNGLEVSFAVKEKDIDTFKNEIKNFISNSLFNIKSNIKFEKRKFDDKTSFNKVWFSKEQEISSGNNAYISGVPYWINFNSCCDNLEDVLTTDEINKLVEKYKLTDVWSLKTIFNSLIYKSNKLIYKSNKCINYSFIFDIGEIEVTASRESISYSDETVKTIQNRFKAFFYEYLEKTDLFVDRLNNCKNADEVNNLVNEYSYIEKYLDKGKTCDACYLESKYEYNDVIDILGDINFNMYIKTVISTRNGTNDRLTRFYNLNKCIKFTMRNKYEKRRIIVSNLKGLLKIEKSSDLYITINKRKYNKIKSELEKINDLEILELFSEDADKPIIRGTSKRGVTKYETLTGCNSYMSTLEELKDKNILVLSNKTTEYSNYRLREILQAYCVENNVVFISAKNKCNYERLLKTYKPADIEFFKTATKKVNLIIDNFDYSLFGAIDKAYSKFLSDEEFKKQNGLLKSIFSNKSINNLMSYFKHLTAFVCNRYKLSYQSIDNIIRRSSNNLNIRKKYLRILNKNIDKEQARVLLYKNVKKLRNYSSDYIIRILNNYIDFERLI